MKRAISLVFAAVLALSLLGGCGKKEETKPTLAQEKFDSFVVGYAKADITPDPHSNVNIWGGSDYMTRLSTGVLEPLEANCIVFTDTEGTTVMVIAMDLAAVDDKNAAAIRTGIQEKTGLPASHIQLHCTHNHNGPLQSPDGIPPVAESNKNIQQKCIQAGVEAMENRAPATMSTGFARPENMVFLRHYLKLDGTYEGMGNNVGPANEFVGYMEKGDNLLQVVKFEREGQKDVVMVNWQGHLYGTLSEYYTYLNATTPAVMRKKLLEEADCESIYIMGGSGDSVQCTYHTPDRKFTDYKHYGTALAQEVIKTFDAMTPAQTGKIYYQTNESFVFPLDERKIGYPITAFGFGDFGYVAEPFEAFQTNAIAVREGSPFSMTFYAQLSGAPGGAYLPDAKACAYRCYESSTTAVPFGSAEILEQELLKMIQQVFDQTGQTQKEKPAGYLTAAQTHADTFTYTVPKNAKAVAVKNGHYQLTLRQGLAERTLLVENKALAEQIIQKGSVRPIYNEQNMVVAIEE